MRLSAKTEARGPSFQLGLERGLPPQFYLLSDSYTVVQHPRHSCSFFSVQITRRFLVKRIPTIHVFILKVRTKLTPPHRWRLQGTHTPLCQSAPKSLSHPEPHFVRQRLSMHNLHRNSEWEGTLRFPPFSQRFVAAPEEGSIHGTWGGIHPPLIKGRFIKKPP